VRVCVCLCARRSDLDPDVEETLEAETCVGVVVQFRVVV
jgi:hypothetical protein